LVIASLRMESEIVALRSALTSQQLRIDQLAGLQAELREENGALRDCLEAFGVLSFQAFDAQLHRRRFAQQVQAYPCEWSESLETSLSNGDLALAMAKSVGRSGAGTLVLCSTSLRDNMRTVSSQLAQIFPPWTYIIGGFDDDVPIASVERLDVGSGQWANMPPLNTARFNCAAAVSMGHIYIVGGEVNQRTLASVEKYRPQQKCWTSMTPLHNARTLPVAASSKGQLLVVGGQDDHRRDLVSAERLEGGGRAWWLAADARIPRYGAAAAALGSHIYMLGGISSGRGALDSVECFDLDVECWSWAPPLSKARAFLAAAAVVGAVYAVGGVDGAGSDVGTFERYKPDIGGAWEVLAPLAVPRRHARAVACGGCLLLLGGDFRNEGTPLGIVERYDPRGQGSWTLVECGEFRVPSHGFAAVACQAADPAHDVAENDSGCVVAMPWIGFFNTVPG